MSRACTFVKYWLPPLLWLLLIYGASGDTESAQHSSRIIGPIVRWFFPQLPEARVEGIVFFVRKCAHFAEYAVLALLLWRALWKPMRSDPRPWSWRTTLLTLLLVAACAASDEIHQTFVPTRQGAVSDVVLDSIGAAAALLVVAAVYRRRQCRRARVLAGT